jgi:hypothetical protein
MDLKKALVLADKRQKWNSRLIAFEAVLRGGGDSDAAIRDRLIKEIKFAKGDVEHLLQNGTGLDEKALIELELEKQALDEILKTLES